MKTQLWIIVTLLSIGSVALFSCENSKSKETEIATSYQKLSNEESIDAEIKTIDDEIAKSDQIANSLNYSKENGEAIQVIAHLSSDNEILKLEEKFTGGEGKNTGKILYYLKNGIPFTTKELFEDYTDAQHPKFVERISYYDVKGNVMATKEKRVNYEEELPNVNYVSAPKHTCKMDKAMRVLNQKGEFELTFQGFVETDALNYLIVGQPGENGYTSAMRIEFNDKFIVDALKNQRKYLNRKCRVSFAVSENSGFEYQVYTGGEWLD